MLLTARQAADRLNITTHRLRDWGANGRIARTPDPTCKADSQKPRYLYDTKDVNALRDELKALGYGRWYPKKNGNGNGHAPTVKTVTPKPTCAARTPSFSVHLASPPIALNETPLNDGGGVLTRLARIEDTLTQVRDSIAALVNVWK